MENIPFPAVLTVSIALFGGANSKANFVQPEELLIRPINTACYRPFARWRLHETHFPLYCDRVNHVRMCHIYRSLC